MMNTSNALPEKMKPLGERLAHDRQALTAWYFIDFQTESSELRPVDVGVARSGVKLEISDRRRVP